MKKLLSITGVFILSLLTFGFAMLKPDFFTQGNVISYSHEIAAGVKRTNSITIIAVNTAGDRTTSLALCKVQDDHGKNIFTYKYKFALDSNFWYADVMNEMLIAETPPVDVNVEVISEMMGYPLKPVIGDTLQPARGSRRTMGKSTLSEGKYLVLNRKVARKESVTVPGGTFSAFVIQSRAVNETIDDYGPLGKFSNKTESTVTEWFVPSQGVVKRISESANGKQALILQ
jgi:hypothetical protein